MANLVLIQGANDYRIEAEIDGEDGTQISAARLNLATSLTIQYKYLIPDGDDTEEATWTAAGYDHDADGTPYLIYNFKEADVVPDGAHRLVGRAVFIDADGFINKGRQFEIPCMPDEL